MRNLVRAHWVRTLWVLSLAVLHSCFASSVYAQPQPANILGQAVATCFSGHSNTGTINDNYVIGIIDSREPVGPGLNWPAAMYHGNLNSWKASRLGQVFGVTIDKRNYVYTTATTCYGYYPGDPLMFGPGGSGGIYRLDGGGVITNLVTTVPYNTFGSPNLAIGTTTIPNGNGTTVQPGLGNITYDSVNDRLYVTNIEDGTIYGVNPLTGVITAVYKPIVAANPGTTQNPAMVADGGTLGAAPLGQRLWGIEYNPVDNRIYYSVWMEDGSSYLATQYNIIRSVGFTAGAIDPTTDRFELAVPDYFDPNTSTTYQWSMPVSDIAFPTSGNKILLGERSMYGPINAGAHQSRVLEFSRPTTSGPWSALPKIISIGNGFPTLTGTNSAGGVDYGYRSYDTVHSTPLDCDSVIWSTGDGLVNAPLFGLIYGLQRSPASGNTPGTVSTTGYFIDLNGVPGSQDKTQIGSVDIFRLPCGTVLQNHCADKRVQSQQIQDPTGKCCARIRITNSDPNFWTSLGVATSGPLVQITGLTGPSGWSVTNGGTTGSWNPPGGFIPTGITDSLTICLYPMSNPPQQLVLTWQAVDGTVCYDTIRVDCKALPPPVPPCVTDSDVLVKCTQSGSSGQTFQMTFSIANHSPFSQAPYNYPAQNILISGATAGVNVSPGAITFPSTGYNQSAGPFTITLTGPGAVAGAQVCIVIQLHGAKVGNDFQWCCPPDTICFTLPACKDCCAAFRKLINLTQTATVGGVTTLGLSITAGPAPITRATATIVAADIKTYGPAQFCGSSGWNAASGNIINPPATWVGLPYFVAPQPFPTTPPAPYAEAVWGTVPSGVVISSAPLSLQLQFPAPPSPLRGCYDSLRFCVRYTFTDTNCVTCDTEICYQIRRVGSIIKNGGIGLPHSLDSLFPQIGTILMKSATDGTLTLDVPSFLPEGTLENEMTVVGISLSPSAGVNLSTLGPVSARDNIATLQVTVSAGHTQSIPVTFDNYSGQRTFTTDLGISFVLAGNLRDTMEAHETLTVRTPLGLGGDSVKRETVGLPGGLVKTYAVYLRNANTGLEPIEQVRFSVASSEQLLAVGPFDSASEVLLAVRQVTGKTPKLYPIPEGTIDRTVTTLGVNQAQRPIYVTISGLTDTTAVLYYTTLDSNGFVITQDSALLKEPISNVIGHGGGGGGSGLAQYLMPVYPNPVAGRSATIQLQLPATQSSVVLTVSDETGREVSRLMDVPFLEGGIHAFFYNTDGLPSGTYYVTLHTSQTTETRSFKVLR